MPCLVALGVAAHTGCVDVCSCCDVPVCRRFPAHS